MLLTRTVSDNDVKYSTLMFLLKPPRICKNYQLLVNESSEKKKFFFGASIESRNQRGDGEENKLCSLRKSASSALDPNRLLGSPGEKV
jgi:hypothetical protein